MLKKILLTTLAILLACSTANATLTVTDVNISGIDANGAGFVTGDTNIVWTIGDDNAATMRGWDYNVRIGYSATKGAPGTVIVDDLNLGDVNQGTGYCLGGPVAFAASIRHCEYTWPAATVNLIADGNYYIDVNVEVWHYDSTRLLLNDANMDTNSSFYIDNTTPKCDIKLKQNNNFEWVVSNETAAESAGSRTTLYYSIVVENKNESYASLLSNLFADTIENGKKDYACYATDSTGNTSVVEKATMQWPAEGGIVVVSRGVGAAPAVAAGAAMSVVGDIVADPIGFATANPLFALIALGAIYLLFFSKAKRKRKKGR